MLPTSRLFAAALLLALTGAVRADAPPPARADALPTPYPLADYVAYSEGGGPGKDGIPSIDEPQFLKADAADRFLEPGDVVFGVVRNGAVRAYPQRILVWHEIVNDELGGDKVSITYCPLTATAIGFLRGDTSLGVSGRLVNSNLIMYDRASDSLWPQVLGTAIQGPQAGRQLQDFRLIWTTWERWKQRYPDSEVLSPRTGYARDYNRDPYGWYNPLRGYYAPDTATLFPTMFQDLRLPQKAVVIGARTPDGAVAFLKDAVRSRKLLETEVNGVTYTAVYDPGLDTAHVFRNPDRRPLPYEKLSFGAAGVSLDGQPLALEAVNAFDAFYFAWSGFYPKTALVK